MHDRILGPSTGIWRHRYEAKYDIPEAKTMDELGYEYKTRAIVLSQRMDFRAARVTKGQQLWLEVIYTMLVESLTVPQKSTGPKTYNRIREVMSQTKFLNRPRKPKPCEFTCAIQLVRVPGKNIKISQQLTNTNANSFIIIVSHCLGFTQRSFRALSSKRV